MTSSAREAILARVAAAVGTPGDPDAEYQSIERDYQSAGLLDKPQRLGLFIERLVEYGAGVYRCEQVEIAVTVAERLLARGSKSIVIPEELSTEWLSPAFEFVLDRGLSYSQIESCDGVITGCAAAISDTGTIILDGSSSQGRRLLTLLPDYHLCIVFEVQVFETVPEAVHHLSEVMSRPLTWISGPSATADIEMTRIQGVHGPRSMDVILVR